MKHKYLKFLLTFTAGAIAGVVGVTYYEIFGKPVLPKPLSIEDLGWRYVDRNRGIIRWVGKPTKPEIVKHGVNFKYVDFDEPMTEYDGWAELFNEPEPIEDEPEPEIVPDPNSVAHTVAVIEKNCCRLDRLARSIDKTQPIRIVERGVIVDTDQVEKVG